MTKHTPSPWEITESANYGREIRPVADRSLVIATCHGIQPHNAEFIVRAVNSHEELLRIAKAYANLIKSDYEVPGNRIGGGMDAEYKLVNKAIAKAEGLS